MGPKGPTLHEVAARAGVSIATVSRVARGLDQISGETRAKVLAAIEELNYRPSHFGRALVKRHHGTLGIVFPGLRGPYYSEVIHGFEVEAIASRMSLLILATELLRKADAQVLSMADRSDGMAIMGGTVDNSLIATLVNRGFPIVTMARYPYGNLPNLRVDNHGSTYALVRHLIDTHHYTRLAFAGAVTNSPDGTDRWNGFVHAQRDAGITPPNAPIAVHWEPDAGVQVVRHILDMPERPEAIVCGNDEIASGTMGTLHAMGIRVPEDIAITGWDDGPFARYSNPPLTTVAQPARELGQQTAIALLQAVNNKPIDNPNLVLPTRTVIRGSCGCAFEPVNALTHSSNPVAELRKGVPSVPVTR